MIGRTEPSCVLHTALKEFSKRLSRFLEFAKESDFPEELIFNLHKLHNKLEGGLKFYF